MIAWGSTWETVVRVLLEMPLLGRLLVGSIELAVLAGAVWLGIAAFRLRSPRLVALLWFVVLLKPLSVLVVGSPLPLMIIETPQTESNRAAMRDIQIPSPVPVVPAPVSEALSQPVNAAEATYLEQQNRAIAAGLAVSDVIFKIRDSQPVLPPATHSSGRKAAYAVTGAWALGIILILLWAVIDRIRLRRFVGRSQEPDAALIAVYRRCAADLRTRMSPRLRVTEQFESPAIVGVIRPVILLPKWLAGDPSSTKTYWALRHELTHWKHGDPVANAVRNLAQLLFFFHPVVWWTGRKWDEAMEFACDRALVESESDVANYAEQLFAMLAEVHTRRRRALPSGLFATRTQIGQRLTLLLQNSLRVPARLSRKALCAVVIATLCTVLFGTQLGGVSHAQQAATPPGARTLVFPDDRSMGQIAIRPWGATFNTNWQDYQDARGTVQIPANTEVSLRVSETACADLAPLANLRPDDLQGIDFTRTPVTDADLAYMEGMTTLRDVDVGGTCIGDEGLSHLQNMPSIEELILRDTRITDAGMPYLQNLEHMKFLMLNVTQVTDEGLASIANMNELEILDMWQVAMTDKGAQYLQNLTSLRELGIEDTQIGDEGLAYLAKLPNLFGINLQGTNISDEGAKYLMQMPLLSGYSIRGTHISDAGIEELMKNPHLLGMYVPLHTSPETIAKLNNHMAVLQLDVPDKSDVQRARVVDADTGEGIAGAMVVIFTRMDGRPVHSNETTGEDGRLALYCPKAEFGDIFLTVSAKGYSSTQADFQRNSKEELLLRLAKSVVLGGYVKEESGAPIAKASVGLPIVIGVTTRPDNSLETQNVTVPTDVKGAWTCDQLPADKTDFTIKVEHPEYETGQFAVPGEIALASLQDKSALLTLKKALEIAGQVVDPIGVPVKGAKVRVQDEDWRGLKVKADTVADDTGNFKLGPCQPGKTVLRAHAPGFAVTEQTVEVARGMGKVRIALNLPRTVSGKVAGIDSKPIDKVSIRIEGEEMSLRWFGVTDAQGKFAWNEAPTGYLACWLEKKGFAEAEAITLTPQEQEYVLTMLPEIHVTGSVVEAETDNKISKFNVKLRLVNVPETKQDAKASQGRKRWHRREEKPLFGRDGRYDISPTDFVYAHASVGDIPKAMIVVRIEADGYLAAESEPFNLSSGYRTYDFKLNKRRPMTGRVLAPDGTPLEGAALVAAAQGQEVVVENGTAPDTAPRTNDKGIFIIPAPRPPFVLCAIHDSGFVALSIERPQDGTEMTLQPWGKVTGEVKASAFRKEGQKIAAVCAIGDKGATIIGQNVAACDGNGAFTLSRVPAGGLTVGMAIEDKDIPLWLSHAETVNLDPDKTVNVVIGGSGRPVTGRIAQFANTVHWQCVGDAAKDLPATAFAVAMKQDGSFRIEALPQGNYSLEEMRTAKDAAETSERVHFGPLTVPEIPGGRSDETLDVGVLPVKPAAPEK